MTGSGAGFARWTVADEGQGRRAADFAALSVPPRGRRAGRRQLRDGLPPRARIKVAGCLARTPEGAQAR
jgi:hypothetical protein